MRERPIHGVVHNRGELVGRQTVDVPLRPARLDLCRTQLFAARIRQQPVSRTGEVNRVKAERRGRTRLAPDLLRGEISQQPADLLLNLQKRMRHRHQQRRDSIDRAGEPRFRHGRDTRTPNRTVRGQPIVRSGVRPVS